ncbi:MAG: TetR/AcrR family transcriptional regulator [Alphaproteobacteria bacterium]|nr:TetR/AcrR family transcriptional regulator [Alphaproteobacteria bacterium]
MPKQQPIDPDPTPLRRDARENRAAILESALALFSEQGAKVPLSEVAAAAGVGRATLYRNFHGRDELMDAVYRRNVERIEALAASVAGRPGGFLEVFDFVLDLQAEFQLVSSLLDTRGALLDELSSRTQAALAPLVAEARARGELAPGRDLVDVLTALEMSAAALRPATDLAARRAWARRCRSLLLHGLLGEPPSNGAGALKG